MCVFLTYMAQQSKTTRTKKEWLLAAILLGLLLIGLVLANFSFRNQLRNTGAAAPVINLAVMGDSVSDEYRAPEDNRGGQYAATTFNWLEQLVKYRNVNAGTWRNWGGHRRTGYEFNYSRSGATTASAKAANAHISVGELVSTDRVQIVYYQLGSNDFAWYYPIFEEIYSGQLSGQRLDDYTTGVVTNVKTALNEISKSQKAKIIVSLVPDMTIAPAARAKYPDTVKLKRVSDAIKKVNTAIQTEAIAKGYAIFNTDVIAQKLLSKIDAQGNMTIGGEKISFVIAGDEPHHVQLADKIHAGTVYGGVYANEWMDAVNKAFGTQLQLFTEDEMLIISGIKQATMSPTTAPTAQPTTVPTTSASPVATATVKPTTLPTNSPVVTARPTTTATARPTASATPRVTATPVATATPTPVDPYLQYCGTYRSFRSFIIRFFTSAQIAEWDKRCGV